LSRIAIDELLPIVQRGLDAAGLRAAAEARGAEWFRTLLDLLRVRARTIDDIIRQAKPYLAEELDYDADAVAKQLRKDPAATAELLTAVRARLASTDWTAAAMEEALRALAEERALGAGKIFQPLRVALTGNTVSPGIFDVLVMLGRELSLRRIDAAIRMAS
jgi:glutamyl-tRNA synthetase